MSFPGPSQARRQTLVSFWWSIIPVCGGQGSSYHYNHTHKEKPSTDLNEAKILYVSLESPMISRDFASLFYLATNFKVWEEMFLGICSIFFDDP